MALSGYVKIHRKLTQWGWYRNNEVKSLFLHCIFIANFKDMQWENITVKRGQFVTSLQNLSADTGLTVQQIRTALKKLKSTGEITSTSTSKYTVITVVNFEDYQCIEENLTSTLTNTLTNEQQTSNKRITNEQQQRKNDKNDKNDKKEILSTSADCKRIIDDYNSICVSFSKVNIISESRKKAIKARLNAGYTYDDFKKLFEMAEDSEFLKGNNERNWKANFDWLIKDANFAKVLDGNYSNKGSEEVKSKWKDL